MCELRHQRAATRAALVLVQLGLRRVQALSWSGNRDGDRLAEVDSRPVADSGETRIHWFSGQTGFGVSAQRFTRRLKTLQRRSEDAVCRLVEGSARWVSEWCHRQNKFQSRPVFVSERMERRAALVAGALERSSKRKGASRSRGAGFADGLQRV